MRARPALLGATAAPLIAVDYQNWYPADFWIKVKTNDNNWHP